MSQSLDAFNELVVSIGDAFNNGSPFLASVGIVLNKECIPTETPSNHSPGAGGFSEEGTMQIQMRVSDFNGVSPQEGKDVVLCKGKRLTVTSFNETGGVFNITAGDITAEVRR